MRSPSEYEVIITMDRHDGRYKWYLAKDGRHVDGGWSTITKRGAIKAARKVVRRQVAADRFGEFRKKLT